MAITRTSEPYFDITSANAIATLTVEQLGTTTLEYFAVDNAWVTEALGLNETRMGVDGHMVAGFTPSIKQVQISLEACSPSVVGLRTYAQNMMSGRCPLVCQLVIQIPSIGKKITLSKGVLVNGAIIPSGQKILAPTTWQFHFEKVEFADY